MVVKDESHGMDCCLASTHLTSAHLQRTSGILDVIGENPQDGFGDDARKQIDRRLVPQTLHRGRPSRLVPGEMSGDEIRTSVCQNVNECIIIM